MMRWMIPAMVLMLAACSSGEDEKQPAETAEGSAPAHAPAEPAPAASAADADLAYRPDPSVTPPAAPDPGIGSGEKAIPTAIQGRWALKAADCAAPRGTDLTALVIDASTLRFFESVGELARVRERSPKRIIADYKFSGEGEEWDRLVLLALEDGGKVLGRRDYGEGVPAEPMRYTRCTA